MTIRKFKQHSPKIADSAFVDPDAIVIGDVTLADDVSVWPMAVIRGDINHIKIGARTNIQDNSILHVTHDSKFFPGGFSVEIGEDVTIGHKVTLHGCKIGNRCLIGIDSTILDGVVIDDEVMVGAGSLVTPGKHLESGYLYMGRPAKQARKLTDAEIEYFRYSAKSYVNLKNDYS